MDIPQRKPVPERTPAGTSNTGPGYLQGLAVWIFSGLVLLLALARGISWPTRWLVSGAALETFVLLLGQSYGTRILHIVPIYALVSTLNLTYAICSTSWLLHVVFALACWPFILLTCLHQFQAVSRTARKYLRTLLKQLQFAQDKIALFNIPALEIDTDVSGLLVLRGVTISLSSLTIVVHGIELGIKVAEDIEMAIYADQVTIALFRSVHVSDCYANVKGGKAEMTFGELEEKDSTDKAIFNSDTPLLRASTAKDGKLQPTRPAAAVRRLTERRRVTDSSVKAGLDSVLQMSPDEARAADKYREELKRIQTTSAIYECHKEVDEQLHQVTGAEDVELSEEDLRAAVCARMHSRPSVPHPPKRSIKVTTLQHLSPPWVRKLMHRLPLLLRLLLAPLAYLHTITISSITAAGSGAWLRDLLHAEVFKHYVDENAELRRLSKRMEGWLDSAHFVLELTDIAATNAVPIDPSFPIKSSLTFDDVITYRARLEDYTITQVVRLGGANAAVTMPSFLLPHHEHLVPPRKTQEDIDAQTEAAAKQRSKPKTIRAEKELERAKADQTCMAVSGHVCLPVCLDQELINFVAAFVKAAKVIEIEKASDAASDQELAEAVEPESETSSLAEATSPTSPGGGGEGAKKHWNKLVQNVRQTTREGVKATRDGVKVAFVGGVINDRWIAKMVGKVAARLEDAQGDAGFSGDIPVPLEPYRTGFNTDPEPKWLP